MFSDKDFVNRIWCVVMMKNNSWLSQQVSNIADICAIFDNTQLIMKKRTSIIAFDSWIK